ncbi:hypothetical protein [Glycomyces sp. NPDC047010]|uniref:hypothetical protein n=1 Tax=Glycomyces sp. NPDC047010 TaxID=3155023 RepID=UPI0033DB4AE5
MSVDPVEAAVQAGIVADCPAAVPPARHRPRRVGGQVAAEDGYVVCHDSGVQRPAGVQAAVCHGFWLRYRTHSLFCEYIERFYHARKVPPPPRTASADPQDPAPRAV